MNPRFAPIVLALATAALFMASLAFGAAPVGLTRGIAALVTGDDPVAAVIMREIRIPRALLGLGIGFSLGLCGAALQGFLRNPLAEPGLIGVSGAASFGAVVVFYSGIAGAFALAVPAGALAGAAFAVLFLLALSFGRASPMTLILAGVAVTSLSGALTALALNLSPNPFAAYEVIFWLLGSLKDRSMTDVAVALPLMAAGCVIVVLTGRALDALSLGEDAASTLGIDLRRVSLLLVAGVALAVGAGTAVSGAIGFVGLVVPHLLRPFTDRRPSTLLLASGFGGATLLLAADIAVRFIVPDRELNVGVVTALIGAPFFLWLVIRSRRELT